MKRKKLYILAALLLAFIVFNVSALCNRCTMATPGTTEKAGNESAATTGASAVESTSETAANAVETTAAPAPNESETTVIQELQQITYTNTQYGFSFSLPLTWEGYKIIESNWEGYNPDQQENAIVEQGPVISLRHPEWTSENPRQDIPIMIFTLAQWDLLQQDKFHIGAAPIGPSKLGSNAKYVFALPARYNFSFSTGYEEVEKILAGNPLKAF
jgi:hypothetical protein